MTAFVHYVTGTGAVRQISEGDPFERDGLSVATFTNVTVAAARLSAHVVDLGSVASGSPWDTCELDEVGPFPEDAPIDQSDTIQAQALSRLMWS